MPNKEKISVILKPKNKGKIRVKVKPKKNNSPALDKKQMRRIKNGDSMIAKQKLIDVTKRFFA